MLLAMPLEPPFLSYTFPPGWFWLALAVALAAIAILVRLFGRRGAQAAALAGFAATLGVAAWMLS